MYVYFPVAIGTSRATYSTGLQVDVGECDVRARALLFPAVDEVRHERLAASASLELVLVATVKVAA